MATDTLGEQAVDFKWGNMPMQPDDDRGTALDANLDSHSIATTGYNGFPDDLPNVVIPSVLGLTESAANSALVAVGLVKGAVTTADNAAGATALNDGKIKTQTPASGGQAIVGSSVALVKYVYTP